MVKFRERLSFYVHIKETLDSTFTVFKRSCAAKFCEGLQLSPAASGTSIAEVIKDVIVTAGRKVAGSRGEVSAAQGGSQEATTRIRCTQQLDVDAAADKRCIMKSDNRDVSSRVPVKVIRRC